MRQIGQAALGIVGERRAADLRGAGGGAGQAAEFGRLAEGVVRELGANRVDGGALPRATGQQAAPS